MPAMTMKTKRTGVPIRAIILVFKFMIVTPFVAIAGLGYRQKDYLSFDFPSVHGRIVMMNTIEHKEIDSYSLISLLRD